MKAKIVCPLGSECESIKDGELIRCAWMVKIAGTQPDGKEVEEDKCAMSWLPIIMLENAQTNRGQTSALESFRNETVKGQNRFNTLLEGAVNNRQEELTDGIS